MADPADMAARMKVLSNAYAAQLPDSLKQIEQAWNHLPQDAWNEEGFQNLHRLVHRLTGSGKTFGFALLSDVARDLEEYLVSLAQAKSVPGEEQRKRVKIFLGDLQQALEQH